MLSFLKYFLFNFSSIFNDIFLFMISNFNENYFKNNLNFLLKINKIKWCELTFLINIKLVILFI